MQIVKTDIIVDNFGGKLEVMSYPSKKGLATVKVITPGEWLNAKENEVIRDFNVYYGRIHYVPENSWIA